MNSKKGLDTIRQIKMFRIGFVIFICFVTACSSNDPSLPNFQEHSLEQSINYLKNPQENYVLVASHRGNWQVAPENSLESIKSCINLNVDIVEIDLRRTQDGHLVLMHDSDLKRTTNGNGAVTSKTLREIKELYLKDRFGNLTNYRVPTFKEAMQLAKGKIIVMVDKANDYFQEVNNILMETETVGQVLFIEPFKYDEAIENMSQSLFANCLYVPRIKENVDDKMGYIAPFINNQAAEAFEIRFSSTTSHTLDVISVIKESNISIWMTALSSDMVAGYTDQISLNNPELGWGKCIELGANVLMTDYPENMIEYLNDKELH